jgi:hypothetical protein
MQSKILSFVLGASIASSLVTSAIAFPRAPGQSNLQTPSILHSVQLVCNPSRCIDPRTGAFTQSVCDYRGCRPSGGVIGYDRPGPGYPPPPPYGGGQARGLVCAVDPAYRQYRPSCAVGGFNKFPGDYCECRLENYGRTVPGVIVGR